MFLWKEENKQKEAVMAYFKKKQALTLKVVE